MSLHHQLRVGVASGLAGLLLVTAGCASMRPNAPAAQASPQSNAPADSTGSTASSNQTATQWGVDHAPETAGAPEATAAEASPPITGDVVNPSAPMRYTVKRGDTLWGISSMFLRDPWLWPEIWYDNPQIHNPHLIYPGDVLVLAYAANGQPRIYVEHGGAARAEAEGAEVLLEPRLRSSPLQGAIPTIPNSAIAAFLSRPAIVTKGEVDRAPHVVAFRDLHQVAGSGEDAYIDGLHAPVGARFVILHIGEKLRDPQSGRILGYQGLYTATAQVVSTGQPEKVLLTDSARETLAGDCLFRDTGATPLDFVPRAPASQVKGQIISVIDDVDAIGQYDVVAINRGTNRGVVPGTVLAVDQVGSVVTDRGPAAYANWGRADMFSRDVRLPSERAGTLLVFKSYDDMSYALVVGASQEMQVGDIVRNP